MDHDYAYDRAAVDPIWYAYDGAAAAIWLVIICYCHNYANLIRFLAEVEYPIDTLVF